MANDAFGGRWGDWVGTALWELGFGSGTFNYRHSLFVSSNQLCILLQPRFKSLF